MEYENIPIIASLHPSKEWNLKRIPEFSFDETWDLIRKNIAYSKKDEDLIYELLNK